MKAALPLAAAVLALASALPVAADDAPDVALGYSLLDLDEDARHGGSAALSFTALGRVRIWLDASLHKASTSGVDLATTTLMAGPGARFGSGRTRFFARALAGLVRERASITVFDAEIAEVESGLGVLAGGGLDVELSGRLGLRVQGDYLWRDVETGASSGWRAGAGIVYRLGNAP